MLYEVITISALFVSLSPYISSDQESEDYEAMKKTVADMALVYKTSIKNVVLEGNPIKAVLADLQARNLRNNFV